MKVLVDGGLYIESDERSFKLVEYTGKKDSKDNEITRTLGWFPSISQLLKFYLRQELKKTDVTTIKELIKEYEKLEQKVDNLVKF